MKKFYFFGLLFVCMTSISCGDSTGDSTTESSTGLKYVIEADFSGSAASTSLSAISASDCGGQEPPTAMDDPSYTPGEDCDNDGGVVSLLTPSQYALGIKRASMVKDDGTLFDLIADQGALTNAEVITLSTTDASENIVTLAPGDLEAGTYTGIRVELYYYQMTFPVAGETSNVRIYMSDDDFEAEGSLGHHQGDITFMGDDGTEAGWVDSSWLVAGISTTRGEAQNGAGGTDSETGHDRGFFGDASLWNQTDLNQGAGQDIYFATFDFQEALVVPDPSTITDLTTLTMTFSAADTFYYEDFVPRGTGFFPDAGGEAKSENDEWAPLTPTADIEVQ